MFSVRFEINQNKIQNYTLRLPRARRLLIADNSLRTQDKSIDKSADKPTEKSTQIINNSEKFGEIVLKKEFPRKFQATSSTTTIALRTRGWRRSISTSILIPAPRRRYRASLREAAPLRKAGRVEEGRAGVALKRILMILTRARKRINSMIRVSSNLQGDGGQGAARNKRRREKRVVS
jgi:hypothetical protein